MGKNRRYIGFPPIPLLGEGLLSLIELLIREFVKGMQLTDEKNTKGKF